ncbi:MAG: FkbM family methyltransferase [Magnetococcales bacterium]|nr:FkbM family methyltransferase [Magnetococcales bacterium]NGZ25539.1 FkbM family methyltransferase [Magnetococcales bacterium]
MAVQKIAHIHIQDGGVDFFMDLDPASRFDNTIISHLAAGSFYEPDVISLIMRTITPGDVVIDVGANVGYFSCLLALLVGKSGKVVAFEPDSNNLSGLTRNLAANQLDNILIINKPASNKKGFMRFFNNEDSGGHALWDAAGKGNFVEMETTTLDEEFRKTNLAPPKLIKIDTEGADHLVLEGARELLKDHKVPYIVAEVLPQGLAKFGSSQMQMRRYMKDFGYDTFAIYWRGHLPKLIPADTVIEHEYVMNILFSTPEDVGRAWPTESYTVAL